MGVSYGIDLGKLDVCFGGFSPTPMGDVFVSSCNAAQTEDRIRALKAAREHAAQVEASRESDEAEYADDASNVWLFVEIDGQEIKIKGCTPHVSSQELIIPATIEGKPVVSLHMDSISFKKGIRKIVVPDSIISIGSCAFRHNEDLEEAILPKQLQEFKSDWFRNCNNLRMLTLPGELETLKADIFDIPNLKTLAIGQGTQKVMPGAFGKSQLESVSIDPENPFMKTDGQAIYSCDDAVMAALAVPCECYQVREGCRALGNKSFSTMTCVKQVELPESLEVIGNFAFSKTSIQKFSAPSSVRLIMEKAFFDCESLVEVSLNEGLQAIEKNAFTATAICQLTLPSTIEQLEYPIAARTDLIYSGKEATFRLAENSATILMDESGGLYRKVDDGLYLIHMLDDTTQEYQVLPGTSIIEPEAFSSHPSIERVEIPPTVHTIGDAAFKNCHRLAYVETAEGLASIGKDAFLNTSLTRIFIPQTLEHMGDNALVTRGSRHGSQAPSLHEVEIAPGNPKFYKVDGLFLERKNERTSKIIVCLDDRAQIVVPPEVDEISSYAFNGAQEVNELVLSDRISTVGIRGLAVSDHLDLIHIDLMRPIGDHTCFDFRFPDTTRGRQQQLLALSTSAFINVESLFDHYDSSIVNASSFDALNEEGLGLYEQATRVIDRLLDPIYLSDSNRAMCERILSKSIEQICVEMAKHDDRSSIQKLLDMGYLNKDNIHSVIDRVAAVQDASMTGYLLEINRRWSSVDDLDFEL